MFHGKISHTKKAEMSDNPSRIACQVLSSLFSPNLITYEVDMSLQRERERAREGNEEALSMFIHQTV